MQQNDGTMKPLTKEQLRALMEDGARPDMGQPIPIFRIGDLLDIRGGKFRIVALGTKEMRLRGVPWSTTE